MRLCQAAATIQEAHGYTGCRYTPWLACVELGVRLGGIQHYRVEDRPATVLARREPSVWQQDPLSMLALVAACLCVAGNTVLCPQSCLNLGSWATLFKLKSNCMCEQEKLYLLQAYSMAVATDAGVALGGLILIYFGSCFMHAYLISEHTHAGYDYRKVSPHAVALWTE